MAHHQPRQYLTEWSHVTNISQPIWNYLLDAHISYLAFNREITESELQQSSSPNAEVGHAVPSISLAKKKFLGKYAISAEEFSEEMVHNINFCIRSFFSFIRKTWWNQLLLCWFSFLLALCLRSHFYFQVGAKSRNIAYLKGKVPSWVGVPTSVAIPFGTFEKVLSDGLNKVSWWFFFDIIYLNNSAIYLLEKSVSSTCLKYTIGKISMCTSMPTNF